MAKEYADVDPTPILEAACHAYHVSLLELVGLADEGELRPDAPGVELIVSYVPGFSLPWLAAFTQLRKILEAIYGPCLQISMAGSERAKELKERPADRRSALYES